VIHGIGQLGVSVERVDQKNSSAPMQGMGHPDGDRQTDQQVRQITSFDIHCKLLCEFLNMFKYRVSASLSAVKDFFECVQK
jgi:hypothetical protein